MCQAVYCIPSVFSKWERCKVMRGTETASLQNLLPVFCLQYIVSYDFVPPEHWCLFESTYYTGCLLQFGNSLISTVCTCTLACTKERICFDYHLDRQKPLRLLYIFVHIKGKAYSSVLLAKCIKQVLTNWSRTLKEARVIFESLLHLPPLPKKSCR
jgi:hypothetical protein